MDAGGVEFLKTPEAARWRDRLAKDTVAFAKSRAEPLGVSDANGLILEAKEESFEFLVKGEEPGFEQLAGFPLSECERELVVSCCTGGAVGEEYRKQKKTGFAAVLFDRWDTGRFPRVGGDEALHRLADVALGRASPPSV